MLLALTGCRTQKETVTEYVYLERRDTVSEIRWRIDSIHARDSIVTLIKGDTVRIERWHTQYRERLRVDTVEKAVVETVYETKTETQVQEVNRLAWWQKWLMWIGGIAIIAAAAMTAFRLRK